MLWSAWLKEQDRYIFPSLVHVLQLLVLCLPGWSVAACTPCIQLPLSVHRHQYISISIWGGLSGFRPTCGIQRSVQGPALTRVTMQDMLAKGEQQTDLSGNPILRDAGVWLRNELKAGIKGADLKYIDPSYLIRSIPTTSGDRIYCKVLPALPGSCSSPPTTLSLRCEAVGAACSMPRAPSLECMFPAGGVHRLT